MLYLIISDNNLLMALIEEKIQLIAKEIQEAEASPWTITRIIKTLSEMDTGNEKKLREKALEMLKELDSNAANIYERFSKMKVYSSNEVINNFNRGNIITSLLKETKIPRSVAEKITAEVENLIKDSKIDFLNTGLIRELVNAKLIAYGFEEIRNNYTRVGLPTHEIRKMLMKEPMSGEMLREYNTLIVIPKKAREMHFNGLMHIEDIEGFSHRPFSYSFIAEEKESFEKTIAWNTKKLLRKRKYFCLPPNLFGITFVCANLLKKESQAKKAAELMKEFLLIPKNYSISLELFTPTAMEKYKEKRLLAAKLSSCLSGMKNSVVGVDSKYSLKLIEPKGKNFLILNNSGTEFFPLNNKFFSPTQGIGLFVNINLEKIAKENDEMSFFDSLKETAETIELLKKEKTILLKNKSYSKEYDLEQLKTAIGLTNLFTIGEYYNTKPGEFANKIYKEISKLFPEELLFGLSSEKIRQRFSNLTQKEVLSQNTLDFDECLNSKKCCFTGKATTIKEVGELIDKKVKQIEFIG